MGLTGHDLAHGSDGSQQQQEQQQQQQHTKEEREEGGTIKAADAVLGERERRAHVVFLDHPVVRQLRTAPHPAGAGGAGRPEEQRVLIGVRFPSVHKDDLIRLQEAARGPSGASTGSSNANFAPAEAAIANWAAPLAALATRGGAAAGCVPRAHAEGRRSLVVSACAHDLGVVLAWLLSHPHVHWLEPRHRVQLHNRVASAIVQGLLSGAPSEDAASAEMHPFWAPGVGLRGQGQVVGVGDSGLDMDSCYFFDPTVSFSGNTRQEGGSKVFSSDSHRKVAYYLGRMDAAMTDAVGHGTHVCGTVAGLPLNSAADTDDPAVGMAPGARIGFIDLSVTGAAEVGVPSDLDEDYFPLAYSRGVRIHSDSWGSSVAIYDESAASADKFLFEHPDFLAVFAAGNYGSNEDLPTTVTSPATSKNGLSVGATMSWRRQYSRRLAAPVANARVEILHAPDAPQGVDTLVLNWRVVGATWGPQLESLKDRMQLIGAADGGAACAPGAASGAKGAVLVALKGAGCNLATKIQVAAAGGAAALLLATRQEAGYSLIPQDGAPPLLPVGSMPLSMAQILRQYVQYNGTGFITFSRHDVCDCPSFEDIASYSSFGPTSDRRVKPDVVAPGDVTSAFADTGYTGVVDQCRTMRKQGTSMATPVVAGSAAIARQYFMAGFYPSGARVAEDAYTPSGVLLKAVLMGGASDMMGYTEMSLPLEPAPSFRQGFGRLNLTRAIPVSSIAPPGWRIQVVDLASLDEGESHHYCVNVTGPATVTLAWYDWPASPAAGVTLQNDLDLVVAPLAGHGLELRGNGWHDNLNTVERVGHILNGPAQITVSAARVIAKAGAQKYALVVQGFFLGALAPANGKNPDPASKAAPQDCAAVSGAPVPPPIVLAAAAAPNSAPTPALQSAPVPALQPPPSPVAALSPAAAVQLESDTVLPRSVATVESVPAAAPLAAAAPAPTAGGDAVSALLIGMGANPQAAGSGAAGGSTASAGGGTMPFYASSGPAPQGQPGAATASLASSAAPLAAAAAVPAPPAAPADPLADILVGTMQQQPKKKKKKKKTADGKQQDQHLPKQRNLVEVQGWQQQLLHQALDSPQAAHLSAWLPPATAALPPSTLHAALGAAGATAALLAAFAFARSRGCATLAIVQQGRPADIRGAAATAAAAITAAPAVPKRSALQPLLPQTSDDSSSDPTNPPPCASTGVPRPATDGGPAIFPAEDAPSAAGRPAGVPRERSGGAGGSGGSPQGAPTFEDVWVSLPVRDQDGDESRAAECSAAQRSAHLLHILSSGSYADVLAAEGARQQLEVAAAVAGESTPSAVWLDVLSVRLLAPEPGARTSADLAAGDTPPQGCGANVGAGNGDGLAGDLLLAGSSTLGFLRLPNTLLTRGSHQGGRGHRRHRSCGDGAAAGPLWGPPAAAAAARAEISGERQLLACAGGGPV